MSAAYDRITDALRDHGSKVSTTSGRTMAQCPAHEDHNPSLSVTGIEGQVLIHCHAGCDPDNVLDGLTLTKADLYDEPKGATYSYDDGRIVHRTPSKGFRQTGNTKGTALYRLEQVTNAVKAGQTVHLVEGEKDVHAIESAGGVATTAAGGTNVHKADLTPLHGAHVVAVVDCDDAGDKWAEKVHAALDGQTASLAFVRAASGKDAADHIAAGRTLDELVEVIHERPAGRRVVLTSAAQIKPRPVRWLWEGRLALGTLGVLAGREGLGKSTLAYWIAARMTQGDLEGCYRGTPKSVLVAATEDSWAHTIVPRLMAAGANLNHVYRLDVLDADDIQVGLSLPRDLLDIERQARQVDAGLILLDPLTSRLGDLDSHKDAEVRQALEPLVAIADRTRTAVLGLMHHNKSGSVDPLQLVMGSKAFTAVARSVHTVVPDPDDEAVRLFGTPKNNLGTTNLPTLAFTLASHPIDTDEGTAWTGQLVWGEARAESIREAMGRTVGDDERTATDEATDWLGDYMNAKHGQAPSADVKRAGKSAGHTDKALRRAREKLRIDVSSVGFPRVTHWALPVAHTVVPSVVPSSWGECREGMTGTEGAQLRRSGPVASVVPSHGDGAPLQGTTECTRCGKPLAPGRSADGATLCTYCVEDAQAEAS